MKRSALRPFGKDRWMIQGRATNEMEFTEDGFKAFGRIWIRSGRRERPGNSESAENGFDDFESVL